MEEKNTKKHSSKENTSAGHRKRLRERFINCGLDSFAEHEIVEMMLFYVIPRRDTKKLAKEMLSNFKDLYALLEAEPAEIMRCCNVTENTAVFFSMISQLARSYMISKWEPKEYVDNPSLASSYARSLSVGASKEMFYVICLNKHKRLIRAELIGEGSVGSVEVDIRKLVEKTVMHKSSYIIITHNHPGGSITPSRADVEITQLIMEAISYVDIILIDHIIIAGLDYYSFAKKSLLGLTYDC